MEAPSLPAARLPRPGFPGATAYGLPEFLASCEAVLMGRTTFLPALEAPDWPWMQLRSTRTFPDGVIEARYTP